MSHLSFILSNASSSFFLHRLNQMKILNDLSIHLICSSKHDGLRISILIKIFIFLKKLIFIFRFEEELERKKIDFNLIEYCFFGGCLYQYN